MERLEDSKLKLELEKCDSFKPEVENLGHMISANGLKPQASKVEAVKATATPKTVLYVSNNLF